MELPSFQVLIVDDNEINRDMLARRLHRRDFNISMAVNGREALSMIQANRYDLILLDIMMPEIDGYTVLKYLKQDSRLSSIPVIMISALEEMSSVMQCMEIGADDYLTKPFDPELLRSAIERCLPEKKDFPPSQPNSYLASSNSPKFSSSKFPSIDNGDQITGFNLPEDTTRGTSTNAITLDEVVLRIMQSGRINRKGYLYFSKVIYTSLFKNAGLSDREVYQIQSVFNAINSGQITVIDK